MKHFEIHGKKLFIPSFFEVYNFGGGNGDKDREIVYSDLTNNNPMLVNYYYINNNYEHLFQSHYFDDLSKFKTVGDVYNFIRDSLINKGEVYSGHKNLPFDFNDRVILLDSGAANIIKYVAKKVNYNINAFKGEIIKHIHEYYEFANKLKFDIVVSFDIGGKYTEKNGEKNDTDLKKFLSEIDKEELNKLMLEETIDYLKYKKDYYPKVLASVHGNSPSAYKEYTKHILKLETQYSYKFWGFALGGIASYKSLDESWLNGINFDGMKKSDFANSIGPAKASKIVRGLVGDRPIHALGCGGYLNIPMNYYCGATSFDAASPQRRVGDGNDISTKCDFCHEPEKGAKFSKYFVGGINSDGALRPAPCRYIGLNEINDNFELCGCLSCQNAGSIKNIKDLYHNKENDLEGYFYSRQLIGMHAVNQHSKLCEIVSSYPDMDSFSRSYPNEFFESLNSLYNQIK